MCFPHVSPPELVKTMGCEFAYKLASVCCHLGDTELGHFVSYRRGCHSGGTSDHTGGVHDGGLGAPARGGRGLGPRWWLTSDASVTRVSQDQVMAAEAYMMFYERL